MADPTLHGNGEPCPACALRREDEDTTAVLRPAVPCNHCDGIRCVALPIEQIVAAHVAWARRQYWPEFERRISR